MKKEKGNFDASQSFLYSKCMREWWPALDAHRQILHYKKGETIFTEGARVDGVFFMLKGVVKVHKHWTDDKELIVRFAKEQDILGHRGLSTHSLIYPITATVLENTTVCFVEMPFFRATLAVNAGFTYDFMMFMADELYLSEQRMRDLAHMQVKGRVAKALLSIAQKFGINDDGFIAFTVSRQDIAAYTGAAYETVYKILMEFSEAGFIETEAKDIAITALGTTELENLCR
ncbi:MAG TPA: Crp/Fnr family transcriptional regulator [Agriterribacter sp.]|nr:Crp/Fnr family transcriptional regulator [Agriterribacter sp.]